MWISARLWIVLGGEQTQKRTAKALLVAFCVCSRWEAARAGKALAREALHQLVGGDVVAVFGVPRDRALEALFETDLRRPPERPHL
jgi:hypothetical protein